MLELNMMLYGKPAWDIDMENLDTEKIRERGFKIQKRLNKIADNIDIFKEKGYEVYGRLYDIEVVIPDDMTLDELKEELERMEIDLSVVNVIEDD